jgi:hypothetical protein
MRSMQSHIHELRNLLTIILAGTHVCRCDLVQDAVRRAAVELEKLEIKNKNAEAGYGLRVEMH